jgi:hypothetical protein
MTYCPLSFSTLISETNWTMPPSMPQNIIVQIEPSLTDLDPSEYGPTVVVRTGTAEGFNSRAHTSVTVSKPYPPRDRQMILTTRGKDGVTVTYIDPRKSELSKGKVLSEITHGLGSVIEFWPQGSLGPRIPIKQDSCVYLQDGVSRMFGRDGSIEGPYPSRPPLSIPPPLIQPPKYSSNASQVTLQHHFDLQYPASSGLIRDCSGNVVAVDPRCLSLQGDFTHGQLTNNHECAGGQVDNGDLNDLHSLSDDWVNNQIANGEPSHDHSTYGESRGPEWEGGDNEGVNMQLPPQPGELFDWPGGYM